MQYLGLLGDLPRVHLGDAAGSEGVERAAQRAEQQSRGDQLVVHRLRRAP